MLRPSMNGRGQAPMEADPRPGQERVKSTFPVPADHAGAGTPSGSLLQSARSQRHSERRTLPRAVGLHPDAALHRLDERVDDRETDPGAALGT